MKEFWCLRRDFWGGSPGTERGTIIYGWRQLRNKDLPNFYSLQDIVRVIKRKRIRYARHLACVGGQINR
jgi:hypothetical protein